MFLEKVKQSQVLISIFRKLEGRVLTIIDASFTEKQQCEAVKSLVRQALWDEHFTAQTKLFPMEENDQLLKVIGQSNNGNGHIEIESTK